MTSMRLTLVKIKLNTGETFGCGTLRHSLQHLWMQNNLITTVADGSLSCLTALMTLDLSGNELRRWTVGMLEGLPTLTSLR